MEMDEIRQKEVRNFLHAWCSRHKIGFENLPVYYNLPFTESKHHIQVKLGEKALGSFIGAGAHMTLRIARANAAADICSKLIEAGLMTQVEFESFKPTNTPIVFPIKDSTTSQSQKSPDAPTGGKNIKEAQVITLGDSPESSSLSSSTSTNRDPPVSVDANRRPVTKRQHESKPDIDQPRKRPKPDDDDGIEIIEEIAKTDTARASNSKAADRPSTSAQQQQRSTIADARRIQRPPYTPPPHDQLPPTDDQDDWQRRVDADIWEHYRRNKQTTGIFDWKMKILKELSKRLDRTMRESFRLFPVGSTINGLGSYNSDMDVCMVVFSRDEQGREYVNDFPQFAKRALYRIRQQLSYQSAASIRNLQVIPAKVPILRFDYVEGERSVEIDLNINNLMGIRNSHLMHHYSLLDERFPAMALLIKHWAIVAGINDAADGTLSSYALILMLIHYLQYGMTTGEQHRRSVLPSLQSTYPQMFSEHSDVRSLCMDNRLDEIAKNDDPRLNMAELLSGFLKYYRDFDFSRKVISIRCGRAIERDQTQKRKLIWIEEPFQGDNVARAVCDREKYERILSAFEEGYENLRKGKTLKAIGVILL